jgi:hypothetical protein
MSEDVSGTCDSALRRRRTTPPRPSVLFVVRALFFNQAELSTMVENQRLKQIRLAPIFVIGSHLQQTLYVGARVTPEGHLRKSRSHVPTLH